MRWLITVLLLHMICLTHGNISSNIVDRDDSPIDFYFSQISGGVIFFVGDTTDGIAIRHPYKGNSIFQYKNKIIIDPSQVIGKEDEKSPTEESIRDIMNIFNRYLDSLPNRTVNKVDLDTLSIETVVGRKPNEPLDTIPVQVVGKELLDTINQVKPLQKIDSLSDTDETILQDSLYVEDRTRKKRRNRIIPYIKPMDSVTIADYIVMYLDGRKHAIDTTLTITEDYEMNFLRKDYFELLPMPNMGQGFNYLGYDFLNLSKNPDMGATDKHQGYYSVNDVPYYHVPSPLTELFFKTTFEQGHHLDTQLTMNTSPKFNIYLGFKGFRSLGKYISSRSASSQFRMSTQYQNYSQRFRVRAHYATQLIENQVNGGLTSDSDFFYVNAPFYPTVSTTGEIELDDNGDPVLVNQDEFLDRSLLLTTIEGNNNLGGKRFFIQQTHRFFQKPEDSTNYLLELRHHYRSENKYYDFTFQGKPSYFGDLIDQNISEIYDRVDFDTIEHKISSVLDFDRLGRFSIDMEFLSWLYQFTVPTYKNDQQEALQPKIIDATQTNISFAWDFDLSRFTIRTEYENSLKQQYRTNYLSLKTGVELPWKLNFWAHYQYLSRPLDFNFYAFQSPYSNYNWEINDWKNQVTGTTLLKLKHDSLGHIEIVSNKIDGYGYFKNTSNNSNKYSKHIVEPTQFENSIDYLKIRFHNNLHFGKFSFISTVQFQELSYIRPNITDNSLGDQIITHMPIDVPKWLLRNSIVFSSHIFRKQMFIRTGLTFRFFNDHKARQYNPLLGQFAVQDHTEIGEFPIVELFINAKIQQTRLFLKLENFGSWVEQRLDERTLYDFYSDPVTPYRDPIIRFGLIWNFFQ